MIQNISHTARKPSVREDENMIRVCVICHGNICTLSHNHYKTNNLQQEIYKGEIK